MVGWVSVSIALCLVSTQTTIFTQSLSNFTCKLLKIRGGTLSIFDHEVRGDIQIWHSVHKTLWARNRLQWKWSSYILTFCIQTMAQANLWFTDLPPPPHPQPPPQIANLTYRLSVCRPWHRQISDVPIPPPPIYTCSTSYISAFCMQTMAQANLWSFPPYSYIANLTYQLYVCRPWHRQISDVPI